MGNHLKASPFRSCNACVGRVRRMDIEVCSNCYSPRIAPYMGYETGKRFICQDCNHISAVTFEFENIDALVAFLQARKDAEEEEQGVEKKD